MKSRILDKQQTIVQALLLFVLSWASSIQSSVTEKTSRYKGWKPYITPLRIPSVVDMRNGGSLDMYMGINTNHTFGAGLWKKTSVYGYGTSLNSISYPGPTILVSTDVPISINWHNQLPTPHILDEHIETSLLMNTSKCYPKCGIPAIVHVHGLQTPAEYDGLPIYAFGKGKSRKDFYTNSQPGATLVYHDHSLGLTRLNIWAGMIGLYIIEDTKGIDSSIRVDCDIPLLIQDKLFNSDGAIAYPEPECSSASTMWVPEGYGSVNLVNGVVFPYVKIPQEQCRLRLINGASARRYSLAMPFANLCQTIAKELPKILPMLLIQNFYPTPFPP
jgi:FtsP/CotA-like multicopper oxidase with cupredoxin domain